jgi:signal peptidase I
MTGIASPRSAAPAGSRARKAASTTIQILLAISVGLAVIRVCNVAVVAGISMEPTLTNGDHVVFSRLARVERGDLIVFRSPADGAILVKRVVGVPGDRLLISGPDVWLNGHYLYEHYRVLSVWTPEPAGVTVSMKQNQYFVLGDNRALSTDSRAFGPISDHQVLGRVWLHTSGERFNLVSLPI